VSEKGVCLVIGAGDDTGGAVGRAFAREGYASCLVRRPRNTDEREALAQSTAWELGPQNIHVAHVIVDGMIDSRFIRENIRGVDDLRKDDGILNPDHIAQHDVMLHNQPRDAWTHELDCRP